MEKGKRLLSLDALRGFDMLWIMGLSELVACICALFPGGSEWALAQNMEHVAWNGLHLEDLIFPTFLFIAGISFPYSMESTLRKSNGSKKALYLKIFKRAFLLILLGAIEHGLLRFSFENFRIPSVLGRIGIAWMFAAIIYINCGKKLRFALGALLLAGYWALVRFVPAPDAIDFAKDGVIPGVLSMEGNIVGYVDRHVLPGSLYEGCFDPEGILSNIPAIVTALLGMFAGDIVRGNCPKMVGAASAPIKKRESLKENISNGTAQSIALAATGTILIVAGLLWSLDFPINKNLWSSSFVLVAGGIGFLLFALFYYVIDVRGWNSWTMPLEVVGKNSITIYMAQSIIGVWGITRFFFGGIAELLPYPVAEVLLHAGYLSICWLFLFFLYKKNTFLKV